jgi:hypothetical protein
MNKAKYILIILALSAAIYVNGLHNEFLSDDLPIIENNPQVDCLTCGGNLPSATYALNYRLGGKNPVGYHLVNIGLHAINSVLVFFFLGLFFAAGPSFWGALVFAAHPIHTEAVTWISGRGYLLWLMFLLSSFLLYLRATSGNKVKRWELGGALVLYVGALYSVTVALFSPAFIMLYDFTFGRWKRQWKFWLVFMSLTFLRLWTLSGAVENRLTQTSRDLGVMKMSNPLFNTAYSLVTHFWLLIWPARLTLYHEPYVISPLALWLEILLLVLLLLFLPWLYRKEKALFLAVGLFVFFLAQTFSPVMISWLIADRYLYVPSLAWSMLCAFLVSKFAKTRKARIIAATLMSILVAAYSWRAIVRNAEWKNQPTLWRATVAASPLSAKAHNNMGDVYSREGDLQKAAEEFATAIKLKPNYADAYHNLAYTLQQMGKNEEAIPFYQKAIAFNPGLYQSYQNLGVIYFNSGRYQLAQQCFEKALRIMPGNRQLEEALEASRRKAGLSDKGGR